MNAVVDAGAAEAGRDPRAIRRLANIGGTVSVDYLAAEPDALAPHLAYEEGQIVQPLSRPGFYPVSCDDRRMGVLIA